MCNIYSQRSSGYGCFYFPRSCLHGVAQTEEHELVSQEECSAASGHAWTRLRRGMFSSHSKPGEGACANVVVIKCEFDKIHRPENASAKKLHMQKQIQVYNVCAKCMCIIYGPTDQHAYQKCLINMLYQNAWLKFYNICTCLKAARCLRITEHDCALNQVCAIAHTSGTSWPHPPVCAHLPRRSLSM